MISFNNFEYIPKQPEVIWVYIDDSGCLILRVLTVRLG